MIEISNSEVVGWQPAIRGMRNPMNSWDRSDTTYHPSGFPEIGPNDLKLMKDLIEGGPVHAKFRRMIICYVDVNAPLYWWKEYDTYKVGTVANSCSTMHKIQAKEFTMDDFSFEHLLPNENELCKDIKIPDEEKYTEFGPEYLMRNYLIPMLNKCRDKYNETKDKTYWWQMIQLLPSAYNQKRTLELSYEVLANIYKWRVNHKQDEWRTFCKWIEDDLPYSEIITHGLKEEN